MIVRTMIQPTVTLRERYSLAFRLTRVTLLGLPLLGLVSLATMAYSTQVREEKARQEFQELDAGQFSRDREQLQKTDIPESEVKRIEGLVDEINRARRSAGAQAGPILRDIEDTIETGTRLDRLSIEVMNRGVEISLGGTAAGIATLDETMQRLGRSGSAGGIMVRRMEELGEGRIGFSATGLHSLQVPDGGAR